MGGCDLAGHSPGGPAWERRSPETASVAFDLEVLQRRHGASVGSAPAAQHDSGSSFDRQGCSPVSGDLLASDSSYYVALRRRGCGRASRVHLRSLWTPTCLSLCFAWP